MAMDSGIFDIVAHPDVFLVFRKDVPASELPLFDQNTPIAMKMICDKSAQLNIPLEINIRGREKKQPFPSDILFKEAANSGCLVLFGCDAHDPSEVIDFQDN